MSQYDREGAGMNCGGRDQFGITKDDLIGLREHLREQSSERNVAKSISASEMVADLNALINTTPTRKDFDEFFRKHPDARIVTVGGCLTKNGFEAH